MDSYKYNRRACRPRLSHRSLDRQPNDHLGRSCFRPHLFEHRRPILRGCTESDPDSNADGYSHGYVNSNTDGDSNANTYTDADSMHWEMFTHAEAAPDSGASVMNVKVMSDA